MMPRRALGIRAFCVCLLAALAYMVFYGARDMHLPASVNAAVLLMAVLGLPGSLLITRQSFIYKSLILVIVTVFLYLFAVTMVRLGFVVPHQDQCMLAGHHHGGGSDLPFVVSLFSVWYLVISAVFLFIGVFSKLFFKAPQYPTS